VTRSFAFGFAEIWPETQCGTLFLGTKLTKVLKARQNAVGKDFSVTSSSSTGTGTALRREVFTRSMKLFIASDLLAGEVRPNLCLFYIVARYIDYAPPRLASALVSAPRAFGAL